MGLIKKILEKVTKFSLVETIREFYVLAPEDSEEKEDLYKKWNQLSLKMAESVTTRKQIDKALDLVPISGESRKILNNKKNKLLLKKVENFKNFHQAEKALNTSYDIEVKTAILYKMLSFCKTREKAQIVCFNTLDGSTVEKAALAKINAFDKL